MADVDILFSIQPVPDLEKIFNLRKDILPVSKKQSFFFQVDEDNGGIDEKQKIKKHLPNGRAGAKKSKHGNKGKLLFQPVRR